MAAMAVAVAFVCALQAMMGETNTASPTAVTGANSHGAKNKSLRRNKGKTKRRDQIRSDAVATGQVHYLLYFTPHLTMYFYPFHII